MARFRLPSFRQRGVADRAMVQPLIQAPAIAAKLIQALGVHGKTASPTLGDLVHPVVVVEDISRDNWYSQTSDKPAGGAVELTAGAGAVPVIQLMNPTGSGMVLVIDQLVVNAGTTLSWYCQMDNTPLALLASPGNSVWRDSRLSGVPNAQLRIDTPAAYSVPNPLLIGGAGSTFSWRVEPGIVLSAGKGFVITAPLAASTLRASFRWRERPS